MYLSNAAKHLMLDALDESSGTGADFGSLHTAYSITGTNELTGGTYTREALTWAAPGSGAKALAATLPVFDVPAGNTVAWLGLWDAITTGTFLGMIPLGAGVQKPCSVETSAGITANLVNAKAHGLIAGDYVVFWGTCPTGITVGTLYKVVTAGLTSDVFAITSQGGAIGDAGADLTGTAPFNFLLQECVPETFTGAGTYTVSSGSIDLAAVA